MNTITVSIFENDEPRRGDIVAVFKDCSTGDYYGRPCHEDWEAPDYSWSGPDGHVKIGVGPGRIVRVYDRSNYSDEIKTQVLLEG